MLLTLPPIHLEFFIYLDRQLAKIDSFYSEREKEAQARSKALEIQLRELKDHRKIFYVRNLSFNCKFTTCIHINYFDLKGSEYT